MTRPGNIICLAMIGALFTQDVLHAPIWLVVVGSFAVGWFFNEQERKRNDEEERKRNV